MLNVKKLKKNALQNYKKYLKNKSRKSSIRTYIKKYLKLISLKYFDQAFKNLSFLFSKIDKGVSKGIFKKRKASRLKHRLFIKLKTIKGM